MNINRSWLRQVAKHAAMTKVGSGAVANALKFLGHTAANVGAFMGMSYGLEWLLNKLRGGQEGQAANQAQAQQLQQLLAELANAANAGQQMPNQQYFARGHMPGQYIVQEQLPGQYVIPQYTYQYVPYMPQHSIGAQSLSVPGMLDYNYIMQLARTNPGQLAALSYQ